MTQKIGIWRILTAAALEALGAGIGKAQEIIDDDDVEITFKKRVPKKVEAKVLDVEETPEA